MKADWIHELFSAPQTPPLAIVVAHPDDEVIGVGAQLRRWRHAHFVYVTDGAPGHSPDPWNAGCLTPEQYASARQRESISALTLAGVGLNQIHSLCFTDQQTALNLVSITEAIVAKFLELQPRYVITHPYEGGHPDHDSTAFAVHMAQRILRRENVMAPMILETTSYFNRAGIMVTSEFLPRARIETQTCVLTEAEKHFKRRLFNCFKTQQNVLQYFPIGVERVRLAPHYDFSRAPHEGRLYYELFNWGTTGEHWRKLAAAAAHRMLDRDWPQPANELQPATDSQPTYEPHGA
ncbi:MAG TPA: PIG-L family deacetylase [Verrucomicrobiae bacterium]